MIAPASEGTEEFGSGLPWVNPAIVWMRNVFQGLCMKTWEKVETSGWGLVGEGHWGYILQ